MRNWILVSVLLLALAGSQAGCTRAPSSDILIVYERSGGFAGLDDSLSIKRTGEAVLTRNSRRYEVTLDAETLTRLQTMFEDAAFLDLQKEYLPSQQGSDRFEYLITYQGHTVRTMDGAVPQSLQPILEALNQIIEKQATP
jgi:hypothetical protein